MAIETREAHIEQHDERVPESRACVSEFSRDEGIEAQRKRPLYKAVGCVRGKIKGRRWGRRGNRDSWRAKPEFERLTLPSSASLFEGLSLGISAASGTV
ncbi:hypothetical protein MRX96_004473 [Rhipicephalus microplus]